MLHQIVYRWDPDGLLGRRGIVPVATSLGRDEVFGWHTRTGLAEAVTMDYGDPACPASSVCLLDTPLGVALIRREFSADARRQRLNNSAHVLVGPRDSIAPFDALAWGSLERRAPGALDLDRVQPGYGLKPLPDERLAAAFEVAAGDLHEQSQRLADPLEVLVAAVLRRPRARLALLPAGAEDATVLLWGLQHLLTALLPGPWTFSTFEVDDALDDPNGAPRFIALPRVPSGPPGPRVRVDLTGHGEPFDPHRELARRIVRHYVGSGWAGFHRLLNVPTEVHTLPEADRVNAIRQRLDALGTRQEARTTRPREESAMGQAPGPVGAPPGTTGPSAGRTEPRDTREPTRGASETITVVTPSPGAPAADPTDSNRPVVRCPFCLDLVRWNENDLYERDARLRYARVDLSTVTDPVKRHDRMITTFMRCPNPTGDEEREHFLPTNYMIHEPPLVVGLIGDGLSGKTHLLAAMIAEIDAGGLRQYGVTHVPVDAGHHQEYLRDRVDLLQRGQMLATTVNHQGNLVQFADALLLRAGGRTRPIAFFDVSGEDLARGGREMQFLAAADAFVFVVDPVVAVDLPELRRLTRDGEDTAGLRRGDRTFAAVMDRLPRTAALLDQPVAVAVTKSDLIRFEPPVDAWLGSQPPRPGVVDPARTDAESRDVYSFLYAHDAGAWLSPFEEFRRCTMHFVSATGARERDGHFPGGIRPRRVLEPVVSILAMCGMLDQADIERVGV
ncbi:TRAFAC clade GTPase domain-containing protein [Embleya sp. NPDC055664]